MSRTAAAGSRSVYCVAVSGGCVRGAEPSRAELRGAATAAGLVGSDGRRLRGGRGCGSRAGQYAAVGRRAGRAARDCAQS